MTTDSTSNAAPSTELEAGSDDECAMRGEWLSRLMFGWMVGQRDPGSYEDWLARQGVRLV